MPNQCTNKVIYEGQTLIDLTADTVSPNNLLDGETAHDRSGAEIQGAVSVPAVYDGLDSSSTTDALSANQGRVLNEKFGFTKCGTVTIKGGSEDGDPRVAFEKIL